MSRARHRLVGQPACLFCDVLASRSRPFTCENDLFYAVADHFPVNHNHSLLIPKRHVVALGDLSDAEMLSFAAILREVQEMIRSQHKAEGFNVGINEGVAAGQTIDHLHIHVIPRYQGDVEDPRGGVRNLKPGLVEY